MIFHRAPGLLKLKRPPSAGVGAYVDILRPATADHWRSVASGVLAPDFLWLMQNTSGSLLATIGASATLTTNGTGQNYSLTATDWTTNWVGTDMSSAHGWKSGTNSLWTLNTQSIFVASYFALTAVSGSVNQMWNWRSGNELGIRSNSTGSKLQSVRSATTSLSASNYVNATRTPHAFTYMYNRATSRIRCNTELNQWDLAYAALGAASRIAGLGQTGAEQNAAGASYNMMAAWVGANAETMAARGGADLGGATLITDLGW